jgi:hypothetical protein
MTNYSEITEVYTTGVIFTTAIKEGCKWEMSKEDIKVFRTVMPFEINGWEIDADEALIIVALDGIAVARCPKATGVMKLQIKCKGQSINPVLGNFELPEGSEIILRAKKPETVTIIGSYFSSIR